MVKKELKKLPLRLPKFLHKYFWEAKVNKVNPREDTDYIIERLLDWGDLRVCKWLLSHYSYEQLKKVILNSGALKKTTKIFWFNYFKLYSIKELCSQRELLQKQGAVWPY